MASPNSWEARPLPSFGSMGRGNGHRVPAPAGLVFTMLFPLEDVFYI